MAGGLCCVLLKFLKLQEMKRHGLFGEHVRWGCSWLELKVFRQQLAFPEDCRAHGLPRVIWGEHTDMKQTLV